MSNQQNAWPEERIDRCKLLWTTTNISAKAIGEDLGVTRNAVIGKLHRMGLSMENRPGRENRSFEERLREQRARVLREDAKNERHAVRLAMRRQKWAEARAALDGLVMTQPSPPIEPEPIPLPQPHSGQRPLLSLAKGECRWPSGHGTIAEPFTFCGATQAEGSSYCPRHSDEAYESYVRPGGLPPRLTASYPLARKAG